MELEQRIASLEACVNELKHHIINLIIPLQNINILQDMLNKPLRVDDRTMYSYMCDMRDEAQRIYTSCHDIKEFLNGLHAAAELKYIGARLEDIRMSIHKIEKTGLKHTVDLSFCAGQEEITIPLKKRNRVEKLATKKKPKKT